MMEEKSQLEAVGGDRASQKSGANGEPAKSAPPESSVDSSASSSGSSFPASGASRPPKSVGSTEENAINKELRRLNRALRALSACNQALAQAGSEQELLQQICDVIVHLGGYRMAFIAYAQQDEEKTVRPMANAGHGDGYLEAIALNWSDTPVGQGPVGTAIRENRICVVADTANDAMFAAWREAALQRGYAAVITLPLRLLGPAFRGVATFS